MPAAAPKKEDLAEKAKLDKEKKAAEEKAKQGNIS
jgi:hypothetical protein